MSSKPIAVLGSDIHYALSTLPLADAATKQMVAKANELGIPLVIAGDLHDTKSLHRAECQEAMLSTLREAKQDPLILVGNHDRRNEKAPEHALHFLEGVAHLITRPCTWDRGALRATLIPYQHDPEEFKKAASQSNSLVICHQGIIGADMGHYVQDKSALCKEDVADFRVVSGHYHRRQDIKCGRPRKGAIGLFSYIGNPYTLTFAEAKDPPKGFQILMDDGTLEFVPTNLRKHIVMQFSVDDLESGKELHPELPRMNDLVWIKLSGTRSQLAALSKKDLGDRLFSPGFDYRLDKTPIDAEVSETKVEGLSNFEAMDSVIEDASETAEQKVELRRLYRELLG